MHHSETQRRLAVAVVIVTCASSAGAHAGLFPAHLREAPALGWSFAVSVVALVAVAGLLAARPDPRSGALLAALLLGALIAAWVLATTTGLPGLQPDPEPVDPVAVATKCVEAVGLAFALVLVKPDGGRRSPVMEEKTR